MEYHREITPEWEKDCLKWRGQVLTGQWGHYCDAWDGLPVDETCPEWSCCECTFEGDKQPER